MQPHRGVGGLARPGRGDVDLEKLQDAFMRSTEMPSAKVTRSKVRSPTFCFVFENSKAFNTDVAIATRSRQSHCNSPAVHCDGPRERKAVRAALLLIACPLVLGFACQLPCSAEIPILYSRLNLDHGTVRFRSSQANEQSSCELLWCQPCRVGLHE